MVKLFEETENERLWLQKSVKRRDTANVIWNTFSSRFLLVEQ